MSYYEEGNNFLKSIGRFFLDFIETIVIALVIFVIVYKFLMQPHQVKGDSMLDNFYNGEYVLTNKIGYEFNDPEVGDVVIFEAPKNADYDYIKRIVGVPGDSIMIKRGKVYINNQLFDESGYLDNTIYTRTGRYLPEGEEIIVPNDSYFVIGDNRDHSSDSREWGFVPIENIVGKAWIRYWPLNKIGVIEKYPKLTTSQGI